MKTSAIISVAMMATAPALRAQFVADGATNTLSNTTNLSPGDIIVGTNGSFTLLVISNNAFLTNSGNGVIGLNATSKSNEVRLLSATARRQMGGSLYVGSNGSASRLIVSNGALVENFNGILANTAASSNNFALITGNSTWSNRGDISVGFFGGQSQLVVSNGSRLVDRFAYIGRQIGSSNNFARVTGSGSFWTNSFSLFVGFNDRSNRLVIDSGALVISSDGLFGASSSANDNDGLVSGAGSLWSNATSLIIGDVGFRNQLAVSNGATVWSDAGFVGNLSPAVSNQVIVTGVGSVWTNRSSLSVGVSSPGNRLDVSNGGRLACSNAVVGQDSTANNNAILLADAGSLWTNASNLILGNSGSGNVLIVSNGAAVSMAQDSMLGVNSSSVSNTVTIIGPGSIWKMNSDLFVGSNSPFNRLLVTNGGSVLVSHRVYAGNSPPQVQTQSP